MFCVLAAAIEQLKADREVALAQILKEMRIRRHQIIPYYVSIRTLLLSCDRFVFMLFERFLFKVALILISTYSESVSNIQHVSFSCQICKWCKVKSNEPVQFHI